MALFIAKSPQYKSSQTVPRQIGGRYADLRPSTAENQAIGRIGNLLRQRAAEMKQERDMAVVGDLYNKWRDAERSALGEISKKKGKDAIDLHLDYEKFYNQSQGKADEAAENGTQQKEINDMLSRRRQQSLDGIASYEAGELQRYKTTEEAGFVANAVNDVRQAGFDDLKRENVMIEVFDYVEKNNPGMSPEALEAKQNKYASQLLFANIQSQISTDPKQAIIDLEKWKEQLGEGYFKLKASVAGQIKIGELDTAFTILSTKYGQNFEGALSEINNPKSLITKDLEFDQLSQLNTRFRGLYNQRESQNQNIRSNKARAVADADYATWIKYYSGTLSDSELISLADQRLISEGAFRSMNDKAITGPQSNNPWVVGRIAEGIANGEDMRDQMSAAVSSGNMKPETFISMSSELTKAEALEGHRYIVNALKPTPQDKYSPDKNVRFADAIDLYNIRLRDQSNAEIAPISIARQIVGGLHKELRRTQRGLSAPRFFTGKDYDISSLNETKHATANSYMMEFIGKEEYDFEMKLIEDHMKLMKSLNEITQAEQNEVNKRLEKSQ